MIKLNSHQLRASRVGESRQISTRLKRNPIVLVLDNVLDTYNIGSFFRLADAIAAQKIYLCGPAITPPNIKIHRASIGTWKFVDWQHYPNTSDCLLRLRQQNYYLVACEQTSESINYLKAKYQFPLALVIGNEVNGVEESTLKLCDTIVDIPMSGINKSLNVLIAASVIAYHVLEGRPLRLNPNPSSETIL